MLEGVVALAERREIVERRGTAVLPGDGVVDLASAGGDAAAGGHAPVGAPSDQAAQRRRRSVLVAPDGQHHPGLGMREDPRPSVCSAGQLARLRRGHRTDALHHSRRGVGGLVEEGEDGDGDADRGPDPRCLRWKRRRVAVDEQVAQHVCAPLVQCALVVVGERLGDRGQSSLDRTGLDGGQERVQPRHAVVRDVDDHAPLPYGRLVPLGERRRALRVEERPQPPLERTHRQTDRQLDGRGGYPRAHIGFDHIEQVDEDLGVPLGDLCALECRQRTRVPVHQGLGEPEKRSRGVLGDPQCRRQLQPHRPFDHRYDGTAVAGRIFERVAPHRLDPHDPLSGEHRHHRGHLGHPRHVIRTLEPVATVVAGIRLGRIGERVVGHVLDFRTYLRHSGRPHGRSDAAAPGVAGAGARHPLRLVRP
nr:hypothetical protein GCM10025699_31430 [Microbacterium flavescens]